MDFRASLNMIVHLSLPGATYTITVINNMLDVTKYGFVDKK